MAGVAYVYKRLWNPEIVIDVNNVLIDKARQLMHGKSTPTFQVKWHGATQAAEELGTAMDSDKDGTTTPFQLTVVSSDVGDKRTTAAGFVHSIAVIGNSVSNIGRYTTGLETPKTTVEVFAMNGTTDVLSVRYYTSVFHAYAIEWGTGATHDAEGAITIESPANTTLLQIAATYNESNGGTIHFVDGDMVKIHRVRIAPTAALAAGDGASLLTTWSGFGHTLNDSNIVDAVDTYTYIHYGGQFLSHADICKIGRKATKAAKVVLSEKLVANTQPLEISAIIQTQHKHMYPVNINPT
jgi:hypothetical protein